MICNKAQAIALKVMGYPRLFALLSLLFLEAA
jgi:hypothetical protein